MSKEVIRLSLPARVEYLVTARLVISAVFGQQGFDVDDIEDAKAAVSEACLLLMPEESAGAEIGVQIWVEGGVHAIISASCAPANLSEGPEREISMFLLEALTDEVTYSQAGDVHSYTLFKAMNA